MYLNIHYAVKWCTIMVCYALLHDMARAHTHTHTYHGATLISPAILYWFYAHTVGWVSVTRGHEQNTHTCIERVLNCSIV